MTRELESLKLNRLPLPLATFHTHTIHGNPWIDAISDYPSLNDTAFSAAGGGLMFVRGRFGTQVGRTCRPGR
jgi:hypothetical protein